MGIIKEIIEYAAAPGLIAAADAAKKGLDKASEAAEKKSQKKLQKFLDTNPDHSHLFVSQIRHKLKETYYVYDENQQVKYAVKGELMSMKHHLHIYDAQGKRELATVKETLIAVRSPISLDSHPKDFVIEVGGKKLGKVKTKGSFGKQKFDVTFNDWSIEGDIFGKNYKVMDKSGNIVMTVSKKLSYVNDMHFVDITNPQDEFHCMLIVLALDSASISKSEENKRTIKRKTLF